MIEEIIPLVRITALLVLSVGTISLLRKAEPGWRVITARGTMIGVLLAAAIALVGFEVNVPILNSSTDIHQATTSPAPETFAAAPIGAEALAAPITLSKAGTETETTRNSMSLMTIMLAIWVVVAAFLFIRHVVFFVSQHRLVKTSPLASSNWQSLWTEACAADEVRATEVRVIPGSGSPFLHLDGSLVLPRSLTDQPIDERAQHLLRHESSHLAGQDPFWFVAMSFFSTMLWFHPVAWILNRQHMLACEESCDASAARLGGAKQYKASLAALAVELIPARGAVPCMLRRKSALLSRLEQVTHFESKSPPASRVAVSGYALAGILAIIAASVTPVATAENPEEDGLISSWRAIDLDSNYLKQIDIYDWTGEMKMKIWSSVGDGKKSTQPYVIELPLEAALLSIGESVKARKDFGFCVSDYELTLQENGLKLLTRTHYTDESGRGDKEHIHQFIRGTYPEQEETEKAEPLLEKGWGGAWRSIDDTGGGIAQLKIRDTGEMTMSVWTFMGAGISRGPIGTAVLPITAEEALSDSPPSELVATLEHGYSTQTYHLKLYNDQMTVTVSTDFKDPDRADYEFEDHLKRGELPK